MADFIPASTTPEQTAIVALTFIGAIVGVLGIFWTTAIPGGVVKEIESEAANIAKEAAQDAETAETTAQSLSAQAVERVASGIKNPKFSPGPAAAIYGSIPGALITGAASSWSKIYADNE